MQEEFIPYHQHLLMKVWLTTPPKDVDVLNKWFVDLVHKVKMEVVGGVLEAECAELLTNFFRQQ